MNQPRIIGRRQFVRMTGGAVCLGAAAAISCERRAPAVSVAPFVLEEADIATMQAALSSGALTARALCELYLARIGKLNPQLRAIIETNPDTLTIADQLDRERREKSVQGVLHGIPIVVKDTIETADKMQTAGGSLALVGVPTPADAFVIERLRAAGAIVLGKANLTEWGGPGARMGWSSRGGQTRNPYAADRSPLGSSAGSGSAVAANLAAAAVGAETIGSIVGPSAVMSVVGLKPTAGLVSRRGTMPAVSTSDTIGPMTRSVRDAAILLGVMAGPDPADSATTAPGRPENSDYIAALDVSGLQGVRLGIVRDAPRDAPALQLFEQALEDLRRLGATFVDVPPPSSLTDKTFEAGFGQWFFAEVKHSYATYFRDRRPNDRIRSVDDVIAFNKQVASDEQPLAFLGQPIFELVQKQGSLASSSYLKGRAYIRDLVQSQGIEATIARYSVDALITCFGPAGQVDETPSYMPAPVLMAGLAGTPILSVPMGDVSGLPVGLLCCGPAWSEGRLLRYGYAYEQQTRHRKAPPLTAS